MPGKTILVVDDDPDIVRLVSMMLTREGFSPVPAHSGPEALAKYESHAPALILLDLAMPGMSGYEVVTAIRAREQDGCHTPIVLLTAHANSYFSRREMPDNVDGCLIKPVTAQQLRNEIQPLLVSP